MNSPPRSVAEFAGLFPDATLVVQPGAGHYPWLDDADRFVATMCGIPELRLCHCARRVDDVMLGVGNPPASRTSTRCCDIALRPITTGEPITIDATAETARELATFLDAYCGALDARSMPLLGALVDSEATLWLPGGASHGRDAVVAALLNSERGSLTRVEWLVGTGRWEAMCSAETGTVGARRHLTMLLKIVAGNQPTSRRMHTRVAGSSPNATSAAITSARPGVISVGPSSRNPQRA